MFERFCFLRRRWAGARQGEKGKKHRKDTLSGVFALVNRWYRMMGTINRTIPFDEEKKRLFHK